MGTNQSPVDEEKPVKGWGFVALFVWLNALIGIKASTLDPIRRPAATGDAMTLCVGLSFVLWGAACVIAPRWEHRSILFRLLNGTRQAFFLGCGFLVLAGYLLGRYVGIL